MERSSTRARQRSLGRLRRYARNGWRCERELRAPNASFCPTFSLKPTAAHVGNLSLAKPSGNDRSLRGTAARDVERSFAERGREGRSWEFLPFGRRTPRHGSGDQAVSRETDPPLSRPSRASTRARTRISSTLSGQVVKTFGRCERFCDRKPPLPFVWFAW